jgi:hypothetical protein
MKDTWKPNEFLDAARAIADAIASRGAAPGTDATGGRVACLTEAVMGLTAAMCKIADAIDSVADAMRESRA